MSLIFEEMTAENFPHMRKEIGTQVQDVQSPRQNKPEEEHARTHRSQTDETNDKEKVLNATR